MTRVRLHYIPEEEAYKLSAEGHATSDPKVCAMISSALYGLAGWIENHRKILRFADYTIDDGNTVFVVAGGAEAQAAMETTMQAILQVAKQYPDEVYGEYDTGDAR